MTTPRLLIVDDDLLTVQLLCELAARYFSEVPVDGTDSPLTALEYAKTTEYSAVLTDLVMPGTDGLLHVSEIANHRVKDVRDELKEGEQLLVKVINIDPTGKIRLSRKALLQEEAVNKG